MNKVCILLAAIAISGQVAYPQLATKSVASQWSRYKNMDFADRSLIFDTREEGESYPILWGFDTAWNDYANMLRGVRHAGAETVGVARVSFTPYAQIIEKGVLPQSLMTHLNARMSTVELIGKKVGIALNLDGGDRTLKEVYGGWEYENPDDIWYSPREYIGDVTEQGPEWAKLIDATAAAVAEKGYEVVSVAPLNEPDLELNGTPIELFYEIAKNLKNFDEFPRFRDIRISGGNTLNNDEAAKWYDYNKEYLDEGNTHQLAGAFDTYAEFFRKVRDDGKYATADELHNVMEAMVGVEYGMQTGIWWGSAEKARGEYMKASFGKRLGYAENRQAWSAASVYRAPSGKVQAFLGCSERQARPSTYRILSLNGDAWFDGKGPYREYVVNLPGDPNGAYQTELQRNAETVIDIKQGIDIQPEIDGNYVLVNKKNHLVLGTKDGVLKDGAELNVQPVKADGSQLWNITPLPCDYGGDFSYYFIRTADNSFGLDDMNWNLNEGGIIKIYGTNGNSVQQWSFEYDGDGWFHIRNKYSALYLEAQNDANGISIVQSDYSNSDTQMWRLLPEGAALEFNDPTRPEALEASANTASVMLNWSESQDEGVVTYAVLRAVEGTDDYNMIARGIEGSSFLDNSVEKGSYSYKIIACDESGNRSEPSESISVTIDGNAEIAHYPLIADETDLCDNEFALKFVSAPWYRNNQLYMNGQHWAQMPYSFCSGDEFTIALSVYNSLIGNNERVFSTGYDENHEIYFLPYYNGNARLVSVDGDESSEIIVPGIARNESAHVAITFGDGSLHLYINGVEASESINSAIPEHRLLSYIGRGQKKTANFFVGSLSNLRVFNYCLSPEQVLALVNDDSAVEEIAGAKVEIVKEEYFAPNGVQLSEPFDKGLTIIKTYYSDGTARVKKILKH